jgi:NhaP-type Na+/H+ or K+/H+ antiporter
MNDCCNNQLNDAIGVDALKALYKREGAGSVTFVEKLTNNLPVAGVGLGVGLGIGFLFRKFSKRGKK